MVSLNTNTALDEVSFVTRSEHRVTALVDGYERPRSRAAPGDDRGVVSDRRPLREFEDRHWTNSTSAPAPNEGNDTGRHDSARSSRRAWRSCSNGSKPSGSSRDVPHWFPREADHPSIEAVSDAVVTVAEFDDPYRPVNRFVSLLRETERFRFAGFELTLLEPCRDELRRRIVDGLGTGIIDPPNAAEYVLSTDPERRADPLESDDLTVPLHDDLPAYGLRPLDDRSAISGNDPESATVRA